MSTTGAAAVDAMVKARFDTKNFTRIVGAPEHVPIDIPEDIHVEHYVPTAGG